MRKCNKIILLTLILCLILSGCNTTPETSDVSDEAEPSSEVAKTQQAAEEPAQSEVIEQMSEEELEEQRRLEEEQAKAQRGKELKVVFLVPGNIDNPTCMDAYNGLKKVEETFGSTIAFFEMGDNHDEWGGYLKTALEDDWDIVLTLNTMADIVLENAGQYPDKRIIVLMEFEGSLPPNVFKVRYDMAEASFLAGACAALVTTSDMELANESPVIGFIGGMSIPVIDYNFLSGYIEGARYANENIKVVVSYTNDFGNKDVGEQFAAGQYAEGVDIIFAAADQSGYGVFDAAASADKYVIGVDIDQAAQIEVESPDKAEHILTSVVRSHEGAVFWAIDQHLSQTLEYGSERQSAGLAQNAVAIVMNSYYEQISPDIRAQIEQITAKIISGEIVLVSSLDMEAQVFNNLMDSVKP